MPGATAETPPRGFPDQVLAKPDLALEPGVSCAPGRVMVQEDNILIRESGVELPTRRAPPELPVIG